jgi:hypothetical protein
VTKSFWASCDADSVHENARHPLQTTRKTSTHLVVGIRQICRLASGGALQLEGRAGRLQ